MAQAGSIHGRSIAIALIVIVTIAAALAVAIATNLVALGSGDVAGDAASIAFPLFLVALIGAALRAILRRPHA